jgi:hypothetical protein
MSTFSATVCSPCATTLPLAAPAVPSAPVLQFTTTFCIYCDKDKDFDGKKSVVSRLPRSRSEQSAKKNAKHYRAPKKVVYPPHNFRADPFDETSEIICPNLNNTICTICKVKGHTPSFCKQANPAMFRCGFCKDMGHTANTCPTLAEVLCTHCDERGHYANRCFKRHDAYPIEPKNRFEKSVENLKNLLRNSESPTELPVEYSETESDKILKFTSSDEPDLFI